MEGFVINGSKGRIELSTSKWDEVETKAPRLRFYDASSRKTEEYHFEPVSPFYLAVKAFYADIQGGEQRIQPRHTGYDVDTLIEEIILSAWNRQVREIDWGE
jgi:hypothetical protein